MIDSYLGKLVLLSLASFFVVNLAAGALLSAFSRILIRFAEGMPARSAARFLFVSRVAPGVLAAFAVVGLCVPSYLWLEPEAAREQLGILCLAAGAASVLLLMQAAARSWKAIAKSRRYYRACKQNGREATLAGASAWIVRGEKTTVLAGLLRPRVIVSADVLAILSEEQTALAIQHENAHAIARDNLKRLAILLAPGIFRLRRIDEQWKKFAEWAADDLAVAGDSRRAMALAEALVRVARLGAGSQPCLATSLLGGDLAARIERLLNGETRKAALRWQPIAASAMISAAILLRPATLDFVHRALEKLIH